MKKSIKTLLLIMLAAGIVCGAIFGLFKLTGKRSEKRKPEFETVSVEAKFSDFNEYNQIFQMVNRDKLRYKDIFVQNYGMDKDTAQNFIDTPEQWLSLNQLVEIKNNSESPVVITGIEIKNIPDDDLYISKSLESTMIQIQEGGQGAISLNVLMHDEDISYPDVEKLVHSCEINLLCASAAGDPSQEDMVGEVTAVRVVE